MTELVAVILIGVAALALLYPLFRPVAAAPKVVSNPLEEEKRALYQALRDIDDDLARGELTVRDHAELRARYETRAALVVARLEREAAPPTPLPTAPVAGPGAPPAARFPAWLPWVAGSMVVLGGILLALGDNLMLRLPDETFITMGSPDDPERRAWARVAELRAATEARPGDVALQLELGRLAFALQDFDTAASAFLAAIQADPGNAEAHARLAKVLYLGGLPAEAARLLDRALELDPDSPNALFFRAIVALDWERTPARAIALAERYLKVAATPEAQAQARSLIENARAALAAQEEAAGGP